MHMTCHISKLGELQEFSPKSEFQNNKKKKDLNYSINH